VQYQTLKFSGHAIKRMFEQSIVPTQVVEVLALGIAIAHYPEDQPFPSSLMLGFIQEKPLHVVASLDPALKTCYVITAYWPDEQRWEPDFRTRRQL
jgi:Domain of unknown function (DUF4258)